MNQELFDKLQKLIADKLDIDADKVTLDASFRKDLGADSLDTYELVYAIEEELGIQIPDEKRMSLKLSATRTSLLKLKLPRLDAKKGFSSKDNRFNARKKAAA